MNTEADTCRKFVVPRLQAAGWEGAPHAINEQRIFTEEGPCCPFDLAICVSNGYTRGMPGKDVGLRIRVERELRDQFLEVCRLQDRPAAQVIREFMRAYVAGPVAPDASGAAIGQRQKHLHAKGGSVVKKGDRRTRFDP